MWNNQLVTRPTQKHEWDTITSYFTRKFTKYECVPFPHMWIHMDRKEYMQYDKISVTNYPMVSPLTSS